MRVDVQAVERIRRGSMNRLLADLIQAAASPRNEFAQWAERFPLEYIQTLRVVAMLAGYSDEMQSGEAGRFKSFSPSARKGREQRSTGRLTARAEFPREQAS